MPVRGPHGYGHVHNHSRSHYRNDAHGGRDRRSKYVHARGDDLRAYHAHRNNYVCDCDALDGHVHRNKHVSHDDHAARYDHDRNRSCAYVHVHHGHKRMNAPHCADANVRNRRRNARRADDAPHIRNIHGDARAYDCNRTCLRVGVRGGHDHRNSHVRDHARGDGERACAHHGCNRSRNSCEYFSRSYDLPLKAFHNVFECHGKNFSNVRIVQRVVNYSSLFAALNNT